MKYYRIKYGYGKDEFYSIDETELRKAIEAQGAGTVFICNEGTISGNNIMAIMPDYNRLLGVNRDYQLQGEDYDLIPRNVQTEHTHFLDEKKLEAIGVPSLKQLQ